jgi:hypothetical protein
MENPKRARSWKRRLRPRVNLKNDVPVLYSTSDSAHLAGLQSSRFRKRRCLDFSFEADERFICGTHPDDGISNKTCGQW